MRLLKNDPNLMSSVKKEPVTSPNPYLCIGGPHVKKASPLYSPRTPSPHDYHSPSYSLQGATGTYISAGASGGGHVYAPYQPEQQLYLQPQQGPHIPEATNILNMDTQVYQPQECSLELNLSRLDSRDLVDFNLEGSLSNTLSTSLILGEQNIQPVTNNTDSFTRLATSALNDLCDDYQ